MTETHRSEYIEEQPLATTDELRTLGEAVIHLTNESSNGEEPKFPDLSFEIDRSRFTNKVLDLSPEAHTRQILKVINDSCEAEFNENPGYRVREPNERRIKSYLGQTVVVRGEKSRRRDVVNQQSAVDAVRTKLKQENHPVEQVLSKAEVELKDVLDIAEMKNLPFNVLKETHWDALHEEFTIQVSDLRQ